MRALSLQQSGENLECLHEAVETMVEVKLPRFHPQGDDSKRGSSTCLHLELLFVAAKKRRENRALDFQYVYLSRVHRVRAREAQRHGGYCPCRASAATGMATGGQRALRIRAVEGGQDASFNMLHVTCYNKNLRPRGVNEAGRSSHSSSGQSRTVGLGVSLPQRMSPWRRLRPSAGTSDGLQSGEKCLELAGSGVNWQQAAASEL